MKQYTIYPFENRVEGFYLIVTKTRKQLIKALQEHKTHYNDPQEVPVSMAGCFAPTPRLIHDLIPGELSSNMFGTMFLTLECISPEYVAHECLHAALTRERVRLQYSMGYRDMDDEERLAYYLTACIKGVYVVISGMTKDTASYRRTGSSSSYNKE